MVKTESDMRNVAFSVNKLCSLTSPNFYKQCAKITVDLATQTTESLLSFIGWQCYTLSPSNSALSTWTKGGW